MIALPETTGKGGSLSFIEGKDIPFEVKRVFWIYNLKEETRRGGHAHLNSSQILVCLQGKVEVRLENTEGYKFKYQLTSPSKVLYFPDNHWLEMDCSEDAILVVLASNEYNEEGYIRDYEDFISFKE